MSIPILFYPVGIDDIPKVADVTIRIHKTRNVVASAEGAKVRRAKGDFFLV